MKKIIIKICIILSFLSSNYIVFGEELIIDKKISNSYSVFIYKIEKNYSIDKEILVLNQLDSILEKVIANNRIDDDKLNILKQFKILNNQKLISINSKIENENEKIEKLKNEQKFKFIFDNDLNYDFLSKNIILKKFKNISYNINNIFNENGIWYYYKYDEYKYFKEIEKLRESDLLANGIDINKSLLFYSDGLIGFADNYKKIKLIDDKIIYGVSNKYDFLKELKDDKKYLFEDSDKYLIDLKNKTLEITTGYSKEQKIKNIYDFIIQNYQYSKIINLDDPKIFSGIEMYKNSEGVCEAYIKVFLYMLSFAGIENVENIRGYVIDAKDFPEIGHAWTKIDNKYYDPTFDDPIGVEDDIDINNYFYFGIPRDLFYSNRYNYDDLPEILKTKDSNYINILIIKNLYDQYDKYKDYNYNILKQIKFRIQNNITYNEKITISNFTKILPLYNVNDFKFTKNGKVLLIKKLKYFTLNDEILNNLIKQIDYNFDGYYFFKWQNNDGTYEYRLAYNVEF